MTQTEKQSPINAANMPELDADGHLKNHLDWTKDVAQHMAQQHDLQLTDMHFAILAAVQQFYAQFGFAPATRPLIKFLSQQCPNTLNQTVDNAFLMATFKTGTVARTLSKLAGLPKPANCL